MQTELEQVAELLPDIVHEIIDLIGFADTDKLIRTFGGTTFRFSDGTVYFPRLVDAIGRESAVQLRQYFKSEQVYIPRCEAALRALRNLRFKTDYSYLTQQEGKSGRQAMLLLCAKYRISDRLGWDIVRQSTATIIQQPLF